MLVACLLVYHVIMASVSSIFVSIYLHLFMFQWLDIFCYNLLPFKTFLETHNSVYNLVLCIYFVLLFIYLLVHICIIIHIFLLFVVLTIRNICLSFCSFICLFACNASLISNASFVLKC